MSQRKLDKAWLNWLIANGNYTHAVTFNLRKFHHKFRVQNNSERAADTGRHFLSCLNRQVFRRRYRNGKSALAGIVSVERGEQGGMLHVHCALASPSHMSPEAFAATVRRVALGLDWIQGVVDIREVYSNYWVTYITKCGYEAIVAISKAR